MTENLRWLLREPIHVPTNIKELVGGHPLVAETLVRRGYTDEASIKAFLNPDFYQPASTYDLPGMETAVQIIQTALKKREKICVWGDFDVDGQTATTLLVSALRNLEGDVIYHIPVRDVESHGMKIPWLKNVLEQGVQLIITCDTGIDAGEAVDYAISQDVDVIITDHHELPSQLPASNAIINPHLLDAGHPLASIPGVGVAYKLVEALYDAVGKSQYTSQFLDLVALGIVADVAELVGDTRYLLQQGLVELRQTRRLGLQILMDKDHANVNAEYLTTTDIGFSLAPRLNALGRLDDANRIVEFLTTEDSGRADIIASQLEAVNSQRRSMTDEITAAVLAEIERNPSLIEYAALVLSNPVWHAGVIGIVANRLAERYQRPAVLLATPEGEEAKGSARSVYGCDITEAIATQSHLLHQFGGHAQAAGLSLPAENISSFRRGLSRAVLEQLGGEAAEPSLVIDDEISISDVTSEFMDDLYRLGPFGPGNPALNLAFKQVRVIAQRELGRDGKHLRVTITDSDSKQLDIYWWQWEGASLPEDTFDLAVNLTINYYRDTRNVQPVWLSYRLVKPVVRVMIPKVSPLSISDLRSEKNLDHVLDDVLKLPEAVIWREGPASQNIPGTDRLGLSTAKNLVIWIPPPSYDLLHEIVTSVEPEHITVVRGNTVNLDRLDSFLRHLTGLVKFAVNNKEVTSIRSIAANMGHTELTIRQGLAWLESGGYITIEDINQDSVIMTLGGEKDPDKADYILYMLKMLLDETAAYRRHFLRMDSEHLTEILQT